MKSIKGKPKEIYRNLKLIRLKDESKMESS